jgi:hypothetical protein
MNLISDKGAMIFRIQSSWPFPSNMGSRMFVNSLLKADMQPHHALDWGNKNDWIE